MSIQDKLIDNQGTSDTSDDTVKTSMYDGDGNPIASAHGALNVHIADVHEVAVLPLASEIRGWLQVT